MRTMRIVMLGAFVVVPVAFGCGGGNQKDQRCRQNQRQQVRPELLPQWIFGVCHANDGGAALHGMAAAYQFHTQAIRQPEFAREVSAFGDEHPSAGWREGKRLDAGWTESADLLMKLSRLAEAQADFERAAALTRNMRERQLLLERAATCANGIAV